MSLLRTGSSSLTQRQVFTATFLLLFAVLLYELVQVFTPFFVPLFWAMVLARLSYPLYERLRRATGDRERLAAGLLTLGVMVCAVLPAFYLGTILVKETLQGVEALQQWVREGGLDTLRVLIAGLPVVGTTAQRLLERMGDFTQGLDAQTVAQAEGLGVVLFERLTGLAQTLVSVTTGFLIMLFALFQFFRNGRRIYQLLYAAIPLDKTHKQRLLTRMDDTVVAVVRGITAMVLIDGCIVATTFALLGVPFPLVLGGLAGLLALFPGGTVLIPVLVAGGLLWTGAVGKAMLLLVVMGLMMLIVDNGVVPMLIGHGAQVPMPILFFASVGGLSVFGMLGLVLGPVLVAIASVAFLIYREDFQSWAVDPE